MSFAILAVLLVVAAFATVLVTAFRRVMGTESRLPVTVEWIDTMSVERYKPMLRLLDLEDLDFLKSQPGYKASMAGRLRRQRCDIFEGYLRNLAADFRRTCAALKLVMLRSQQDRPDLAAALLRSQAAFACGLLKVEIRLALYRLGLASVDVSMLVSLFDGMQGELRSFMTATAPALA